MNAVQGWIFGEAVALGSLFQGRRGPPLRIRQNCRQKVVNKGALRSRRWGGYIQIWQKLH